jgi:hypothetical protein
MTSSFDTSNCETLQVVDVSGYMYHRCDNASVITFRNVLSFETRRRRCTAKPGWFPDVKTKKCLNEIKRYIPKGRISFMV